MFPKRALVVIVSASMLSLSFTGFAASSNAAPAVPASASSFAVSGPRVVKQGEKVVYTASVGKANQGRLAVLEETAGKGRVPVSVGRVDPKGEVKFTLTLPVSGEREVQVRVFKGRKTVAVSENFTVDVNERTLTAAQKREQAREAEIAALAVGTRVGAAAYTPGKISGAKATRAKLSSVTEDLADAFSDAGSSAEVAAEHAAEKSSKMVETQAEQMFGKSLGKAIDDFDPVKGLITFGIKQLFKLIFPDTTGQQILNAIEQLTTEMQTDFQYVDAQLAAIEGDLSFLQQQVKNVSNQVTSANASASAANCSVLMSQADALVSQIQGDFSAYQDTLDPAWLTANIQDGSNPDSVMQALGNQVFGSGSGNPSFLQGANSSQQATTSLAYLLTGYGLPAGSSLIDACASAISAQMADEASTLNSSSVQFVTPAGSVDNSYFDSMQSITAYYGSWANIGQFLSTLGSQWAILSLDPTPPTSAASASATCAGVAASGSPSPRAALTCQQLAANINDTTTAVSKAWDETGASWAQVSNNMLGADTRVASTSDYMIPAQSVWALDPSKMTNGQSQSYAQTNVFPAGGAPFAGINLPAANSNQWNNLLQQRYQPPAPGQINAAVCGGRTPSQPSATNSPTILYVCTAQATMGQLISAAGLSFGGSIGGKLIFTGEPPTYWNPTKGAVRYAFSANTNPLNCSNNDLGSNSTCYKQVINEPWATGDGFTTPDMGFYVNPFIDPALTGNNAFSVVVNDPAGTSNNFANALDMNDLYAWSNGTSLAIGYNGWGLYPGQTGPTAGVPGSSGWSGNPFLYAPCQSTGTDVKNTNLDWDPNQSGGSRLWAQWALPLGNNYPSTWNVNTYNNCGFALQPQSVYPQGSPYGWMQQASSVSYGANFNVQVTNTEGVYGWVPIRPHSYMSNVPSQVAGLPMTGTIPNSSLYGGTVTPAQGGAALAVTAGGNGQGPNTVGVTAPTGSPIFAATPTANSLSTAATTGLIWPAMSLNSNTCPTAGGLAGTTSFSQGRDGNAGVTNTCEFLWAAYKASMLNEDTGNLEVLFPDQATGIAPGSNQAVLSVTNSGSVTTSATLYLGAASGISLPGTASIVNGSSGTVTSCANGSLEGVADTQCVITVPPGTSTFTLPIQYNGAATSGELTAMVSDWASTGGAANSFAGSTSRLLNLPVPTGDVPGIPVNLAVTASSKGAANSVSATWTAPSANPVITGYTVTITDPNGSVTTQTIPAGQGAVVGNNDGQAATANALPGMNNSDMQVTATFTLPNVSTSGTSIAITPGVWTFSLTANNTVGSSAPASFTTFLGDGPPPQIVGLSASENANGTVTVSWNPVTASPAVSGYMITWMGSDGQVYPTQKVGVPQFTLPNASSAATSVTLAPGVWTFQVQAQNSQGLSPVSSTQVNVIGSAPKAVRNLAVGITGDGVISAQWNGADAVPAPTTYNLAIYGPDAAGTAILTQDFPVTGVKSQVNIPNVYQIGNNAKVGMYTVVVTGTNAVGIGDTAASDLYISQSTINRSTVNQVGQLIIGSLPASFQALAAAQCQAGLWQIGYLVFGTCNLTTKVFTSAPGLPPFYLPPTVPSTTSPAAVTGASPWDPKGLYVVGDLVTYGGGTYRCIQGYQGLGDTNWITALSLWTRVA